MAPDLSQLLQSAANSLENFFEMLLKNTRIVLLSILIGVALAPGSASASTKSKAHHSASTPPIHHVFIVVLENKDYTETFGPDSVAPYLANNLPAKGALLTQYYGTGHLSLDNYIAMMSGQANNRATSADCNTYSEFHQTGTTVDGQAVGEGCVYPANVKTLANQMTEAHLTWKGYMQDMGNDPARESVTCGHPPLDAPDLTQRAEAPSTAVPEGDMYATRHDPFMYFHSIIDTPECAKNVVNLRELTADLKSIATTPNLSFITPNLCNDGHDSPCANGQPGGLKSSNEFLQKWIPILMASPAYKKDGLIVIIFDEGGSGVITKSTLETTVTIAGASCCNQQEGPNLQGKYPEEQKHISHGRLITKRALSFGGDRTGTVLLSPFIRPGTVSQTPYNHYSLLKSLEDIFGIDEYLGYAGQKGLVPFGTDIFTAR